MRDSFRFALDSVLSKRRRAVITVAIIAVGVSALVGIQSALDVVAGEVGGSFDRMGASVYTIRPRPGTPAVSCRQASAFAASFSGGDCCTVSALQGSMLQIRGGGKITDPLASVVACDENYLSFNKISLSHGRAFSSLDILGRRPVAIVGDNIRRRLFGDESGLGEWLSADGERYRVVGVAARQSSMSGDDIANTVLVPLTGAEQDCAIHFRCSQSPETRGLEEAGRRMAETRRLPAGAEPDFDIVGSDTSRSVFVSLRNKLSAVAFVIGLITMLGAAVGLMNSMLVSVKERTREIGVRRALGAKSGNIARQFLLEALIVGQIGAAFGILLGLLLGWLVASGMEGEFVMPWRWALLSALLSLAVSILSALLPSRRAAALDPVEALRRV